MTTIAREKGDGDYDSKGEGEEVTMIARGRLREKR